MLVTLPFVLLLLDYWPLARFRAGRMGALALEKAPFLVLSAASCLVTVLAQQRAIQPTEALPFFARAGNALVSYSRYLGKLFWPADLALPYPHPGHWPGLEVGVAFSLILGLSLLALDWRRKFPFVFTGWFWFAGTLVPVIGLVQVGLQAMADRYTYLPFIGLFILLAWGLEAATRRPRAARALAGWIAAALVVVCGFLTAHQARCWRTNERLFLHTAEVTKDNFVAFNVVGVSVAAEGRFDEAIEYYRKSLRIAPTYCDALFNLGNALAAKGRYKESIEPYQACLKLKPWYFEAYNNLGSAFIKLGRREEAAEEYRQALGLQPDQVRVRENLAMLLLNRKSYAEAAEQYRLTVAEEPKNPRLHYYLGLALASEERWEPAIEQFETTLRLGPEDPDVEYNLGYALRMSKRLDEAAARLEAAVRLKADFPMALYNLGCVRADQGRREAAAANLRQALRLKPDYPEAKRKLAEIEPSGGD